MYINDLAIQLLHDLCQFFNESISIIKQNTCPIWLEPCFFVIRDVHLLFFLQHVFIFKKLLSNIIFDKYSKNHFSEMNK